MAFGTISCTNSWFNIYNIFNDGKKKRYKIKQFTKRELYYLIGFVKDDVTLMNFVTMSLLRTNTWKLAYILSVECLLTTNFRLKLGGVCAEVNDVLTF